MAYVCLYFQRLVRASYLCSSTCLWMGYSVSVSEPVSVWLFRVLVGGASESVEERILVACLRVSSANVASYILWVIRAAESESVVIGWVVCVLGGLYGGRRGGMRPWSSELDA